MAFRASYTGVEMQLARLHGADNGDRVRLTIKAQGNLEIRLELPLVEYAKASFGEFVNTDIALTVKTRIEEP